MKCVVGVWVGERGCREGFDEFVCVREREREGGCMNVCVCEREED